MNNSPDKALTDDREEAVIDESPAVEEEASGEISEAEAEESVESTDEAGEEAEANEGETGGSKKKGYSQRVRELVSKRKEAEARAKSLEERLAELTAPVGPRFDIPQDTGPLVAPGEEIDAIELDKRLRAREQQILRQAETRTELKIKQFEAINRINSEANEVIRDYAELDPDSDSFDKELSDTITEATEAYVRQNPYNASVKQFVAKLMKPYNGAVSREVGKVTGEIAKQASETALRPTSVKGGDRKFEELSEEEMEKRLGMVY